MDDSEEVVAKVFRSDASWGFWFAKDWDVLPFIGDITYPPVYQALRSLPVFNPTADWLLANTDNQKIVEVNLISPPTNYKELADVISQFDFFTSLVLITDSTQKWGLISYDGDCFVIGADVGAINILAKHLGGREHLKVEFESELNKFSAFFQGADSIPKKLERLF